MLDLAQARRNMLDCQLRTYDITDKAVLAAAEDVPREIFMPAGRENLAYLDQNVMLSPERCMLQPMVLVRLLQALQIRSGSRVLDVASGLGYTSALLARLGARVTALESDEDLARMSRERLVRAGFDSEIDVCTGPLEEGCPDRAPFDAIIVNGNVETRPDALLEQLAENGRLGCIRVDRRAGHALLYVRGGEGVGSRQLFDATAPALPAFRTPPAFVF